MGCAVSSKQSSMAKKKVVFYTTSLRGVRRTYEDCQAVKSILQALRVAVDERDLAMDGGFKRELRARRAQDPPPQVFVGELWIGGAERIIQMQEDGELERVMEAMDVERREGYGECGGCGGAGFVVCGGCGGGRKVDGGDGKRRRCRGCNENGLVRCPCCC